MITFPNAKINLGLNIVKKRLDGYHDLETIFYPIPLSDALESNFTPNLVQTKLTLSGIPIEAAGESNLIMHAYHLLADKYNLPMIDIHLQKNIPTGAGLGGGSADATFMLLLLNKQFKLGLTSSILKEYATQLGADCAFFTENKPVFATGIGNEMKPVSLSLKGYYLLLVKPDIFISTQTAFSKIIPKEPSIHLNELILQPLETWKNSVHNDFEISIFPTYPRLKVIKEQLYAQGAIYASMSGSGSTIYGIFKEDCTELKQIYSQDYCQVLKL